MAAIWPMDACGQPEDVTLVAISSSCGSTHHDNTEAAPPTQAAIEELLQQLQENLDSYPNAQQIVWAQEEPLNAGPWSFAQPRIETLLNHTQHHNRRHVMYAGRNPSASVATGLKSSHMKEENDLLNMAFSVKQDKLKGE